MENMMSLSVMPPRRRITRMVPPPRKRRKIEPKIEEIAFDPKEREDYLSGFHKRRVQRQKQAQVEASRKNHEEKLAARRILREDRKANLQKHVEEMNAVFQDDEDINSEIYGEDDHGEEGGEKDANGKLQQMSQQINHEEEYIDEDKLTTITIEAVDVSRDGLKRVPDAVEKSLEARYDKVQGGSIDAASGNAVADKPRSAEQSKHTKLKPKKKRFKYESKSERKMTRFKERSKGKKQAKERKQK